jgi:glycerophosphoryl diester phosphodiesterase
VAVSCDAGIKNGIYIIRMKQFYLPVSCFLLSAFFYSCEKIKYYPDTGLHEVKTLILAHRGGAISSGFPEYSVRAAEYGFDMADGIEVDLQISKNRTIWLCHNAELPSCGGKIYDCLPETTDDQIVELDSCDGPSSEYTRLEEIFYLMHTRFPGKHISLDVKAWSPCKISSSDIPGVMNVIGDEIIRLTKKYNLQHRVMVESETATFLNYVKRHSDGIECYLISLGDFERAMQLCLESGYTGISFKYKFKEEITADHIQLIRRKGLKVQLWTVNAETDIREALSINPDYLQTDNLPYFGIATP